MCFTLKNYNCVIHSSIYYFSEVTNYSLIRIKYKSVHASRSQSYHANCRLKTLSKTCLYEQQFNAIFAVLMCMLRSREQRRSGTLASQKYIHGRCWVMYLDIDSWSLLKLDWSDHCCSSNIIWCFDDGGRERCLTILQNLSCILTWNEIGWSLNATAYVFILFSYKNTYIYILLRYALVPCG